MIRPISSSSPSTPAAMPMRRRWAPSRRARRRTQPADSPHPQDEQPRRAPRREGIALRGDRLGEGALRLSTVAVGSPSIPLDRGPGHVPAVPPMILEGRSHGLAASCGPTRAAATSPGGQDGAGHGRLRGADRRPARAARDQGRSRPRSISSRPRPRRPTRGGGPDRRGRREGRLRPRRCSRPSTDSAS